MYNCRTSYTFDWQKVREGKGCPFIICASCSGCSYIPIEIYCSSHAFLKLHLTEYTHVLIVVMFLVSCF